MAHQPFLALITPLTGDHVPGQPPSGAHPEHPIFYPPGTQPPPGGGGGGNPPWWPGHPSHPIPPTVWPTPPDPPTNGGNPPPDEKPPSGPVGQLEWHTVWTEQYGWALVGVMSTGVAPSAAPKK